MNKKYEILTNILDKLCGEVPANFITYHPNKSDLKKLNKARSLAFIHLYLKTKCGLITFNERESSVTDGIYDGGVDGYHFNEKTKELIIIQSKFRIDPNNFKNISMDARDLVKIELGSILDGESKDFRGDDFNFKIKMLQDRWRNIPDNARWKVKVVFLGNLKDHSPEAISDIIKGYPYEVYDFEKTYNEMVFPICSGRYYDPDDISIGINLSEKTHVSLKQNISTSYGTFSIEVLFVPTKEIGRILSKYKNSILKYNPRNYLSLDKNDVNSKIKESIVNNESNDFAVFNNGITILAESSDFSQRTGKINAGQIILSKPQIINGGQTACTLSKIYENNRYKIDEIFGSKEVMVKIIVSNMQKDDVKIKTQKEFIEDISNATNQQSRVDEADRRSNDQIQIELQKEIYDKFGLFYERKRGEFFDGIELGFIEKCLILDREIFLRSYMAFKGNASNARRSGGDIIFEINKFNNTLKDNSTIENKIFPSLLFQKISKLQKEEKSKFGSGIRYGKYAIVCAAGYILKEAQIKIDNVEEILDKIYLRILESWLKFENSYIPMQKNNNIYKIEQNDSEIIDFDNYYKGKTVNNDIKNFFENIKL